MSATARVSVPSQQGLHALTAVKAVKADLIALREHHARCSARLQGWPGRWQRVAAACERTHQRLAPRFFTTVSVGVLGLALLLSACG